MFALHLQGLLPYLDITNFDFTGYIYRTNSSSSTGDGSKWWLGVIAGVEQVTNSCSIPLGGFQPYGPTGCLFLQVRAQPCTVGLLFSFLFLLFSCADGFHCG
jgi:hypothetical protein